MSRSGARGATEAAANATSVAGAQGTIDWHPPGAHGKSHSGAGLGSGGASLLTGPSVCIPGIAMPDIAVLVADDGARHAKPASTSTSWMRKQAVKSAVSERVRDMCDKLMLELPGRYRSEVDDYKRRSLRGTTTAE